MNEKMNDLQNLRKKIIEFNQAYEKGTPLIDDFVYDFYKKQLEILEQHETIKISDEIGSNIKTENKYEHEFSILSLNHSFENIDEFLKKLKNINPFPICAELKIDGVTIIAKYENGFLTKIATRGNGFFGQDITHLKNHLKLPNQIYIKEKIYLRAEAYFNKNIPNARNKAAGILLKNEIDANLSELKIAPHFLYSFNEIWSNYDELRNIFKTFGLQPINPYKLCFSQEEIEEYFTKIKNSRNELDFTIDGIVLKINDKKIQDELGNTAKAPKFAHAIKFSNQFNISKIRNIQFNVGKNGKITPVAEIEETLIDGRKIIKATLNNLKDLKEKEYGIDDIIKIEMAGDVIPKITEIIEKKNKLIEIPTKCPACLVPLENENCNQGWNCIEQKKQRLYYFAQNLEIENLGTKQIDFFIENGILNYPNDFFEIKNKANQIKKNAKWLGEKSLTNIIQNIEKAQHSSLENFYTSLGITNIGKNKAKILSSHFENIEIFLSLDMENFLFMGKEIAKNIFEFNQKEKDWIIKTYQYMKFNETYKEYSLF